MSNAERQPVIVAYGRSPIGKARKGSFRTMHPVDLAAATVCGVLDKVPQLKKEDIDDVLVGCASTRDYQSGNLGRLVAMRAGLPESVAGATINRFCSSGLQTIAYAHAAILSNQADVLVAGGVESMSLTPMSGGGNADMMDKWLKENYPGVYMPMGITAENVAKKYGITREEMDQFAVDSQKKAYAAQVEGKFDREIIPITVTEDDGQVVTATKDECVRGNTTMEGLAQLKPCFIKETGLLTAGTSSPVCDGAAFVVMMTEEKAKELQIQPIARMIGFTVAGVPADIMGIGPMEAVPKIMKRTGMSLDQMDIIELNEAFASQSIVCIRELGLPKEKVNPRGGAIALGHPMGATGGILTSKALSYLEDTKGRYALITMCIGGGMGAAAIIEKL